jgi:signal transduction histidine kinase
LARPQLQAVQVAALSARIGTATFPEDGEDLDSLIRRGQATLCRRPCGLLPPLPPMAHGEAAGGDVQCGGPMRLQAEHDRLVLALRLARDAQRRAESAVSRQQTSLAVVAHELRHPLAAMSYAIRLLHKGHAPESMAASAHAILERQLSQMVRIVGELMDVSRACTGKLRMERADIVVRSLVDGAVQAALPGTQRRRQSVDVSHAAEDLHLCGDAARLEQVLVNLLDNASKYTADGGSIRLAVAREADEAILKVSDNGIGISAQALPHVFEAFVQENSATAWNGEGIGLGLMLAQHLIEEHGGRVTVHSDGRGRGSEFVVRLPLAPTAVESEGGRPRAAAAVPV